MVATNAMEVLHDAAQRTGWVALPHELHEHFWGRGEARLILGFSRTGRTLRVALYYPEGLRTYIDDLRPCRDSPCGDVDVVLRWIADGDPDPVDLRARSIVVIPCAAAKRDQPMPASELYASSHFQFTLRAAAARAEATGAEVMILSAKHGLLGPTEVIAPYDVSIGDAEAISARELAAQLALLGVGQIDALLPRRYLSVLKNAVALKHKRGNMVRLNDMYCGAPGIGYQRAVLARILQASAT